VQRFKWQPQLGGRLIVVDKNDLSQYKTFEAPSGFVFHFGQAWEQGQEISLVACWNRTPEIMSTGMYQVLTEDKARYTKAHAAVLTLNQQSGKCDLQESGTEMEFPGFDQNRHNSLVFGVGRKSGFLHEKGLQKGHQYANSTLSWCAKTGNQDEYVFDAGIMSEEPLFIADKSSSQPGSGWLLQTALNYQKARTEVYVFNALSISSGPIAVATMERSTPLGFHGTFVS
jgi:carotenoid cleavage dioxygenase-like enzyme